MVRIMSFRFFIKSALFSFAIFCFVITIPMVSRAGTKVLTIGTGGMVGNYYPTGLAIAGIVNKNQNDHGFRFEVRETEGSVFNINAMLAGDIDFGMVQADRQYQAVNGLAEWKEMGPQKNLRAIFSTYTESVTLVTSDDSEVKALKDLKGKRVDIGLSGSGGRQNAIDALGTAGIDWKKDIIVYEEEAASGPRMLFAGKLDAFFHTVGHPSEAIRYATLTVQRARFIPITSTEKLISKYPYYSKSIIPIRFYRGAVNQKDVETFGVKATFVTVSKVPDDTVYAITKAVFEDFKSFRTFTPVLGMVRKEGMLEGLTAPIHPGAARYYKEIGLQLPPSTN